MFIQRVVMRHVRVLSMLVLVFVTAAAAGACAVPQWPVAGSMTSPYGFRMRGWHPDFHNGVDVAAVEGAPVRAMKRGVVMRAGEMQGYGLGIILQHGANVRTIYGHLSHIAVKEGAHVDGGEVIGSVGHTGNATGPHLHFEIWRYGRSEDPVPLLGGFPPERHN